MTIHVVGLAARDARVWLQPALDIYVTAMEYPRGTQFHRAALWQEHVRRPGFAAFGAIATPSDPLAATPGGSQRWVGPPVGPADDAILVGIAYGYSGERKQWWNQQLRFGLRQAGRPPRAIEDTATDYFELTELHVHPSAQGRGIGQALLTRLLAGRPERRVLLSTPEAPGEENRAWSLYRRMGFVDVLRNFTFSGDPRPFAFLGRTLPLPGDPLQRRPGDPGAPGPFPRPSRR